LEQIELILSNHDTLIWVRVLNQKSLLPLH
jgi:hypothetical protein